VRDRVSLVDSASETVRLRCCRYDVLCTARMERATNCSRKATLSLRTRGRPSSSSRSRSPCWGTSESTLAVAICALSAAFMAGEVARFSICSPAMPCAFKSAASTCRPRSTARNLSGRSGTLSNLTPGSCCRHSSWEHTSVGCPPGITASSSSLRSAAAVHDSQYHPREIERVGYLRHFAW